jgi:hypothetical protein
MSKSEVNTILKEMKAYRKKKVTKEEAKNLLINAGILNKNGKLADFYKNK